jgi:LmbE family N-acetylglucosaminyl deacetylase
MRAIATSAEVTSVQWYRGRTGDTSSPVVGAVLPNLDFLPTTAGEFHFWPRVTSRCGTTDGASVTIRSKPCLPPSITGQPPDIDAHPGASAVLFIDHTGSEPFTYQWFRGEPGDISAPLPSSNRKSIQVRNDGSRERYWVRVMDSCGSADSRAAAVAPLTRSRPTDSLRPLLPSNGILWIAAHPDDEILVAPLLAEVCAEGGGKCTILIATRGEKGICELPGGCARSELAAIRTEEEMRSASLLDATLSAGELPDGSASTPEEVLRIWSELLGGRDQLVQRLIREIVVSGADSIITFDPRHGSTCHPDHRAIGRLAADAVAAMGSAAPRTYFLTTRANQTSGLDGSESVQLTQVDQEGEREFRYDAELRWHYVVDVAQIHRSQFSPATVGALSRVPPEDRVVGLIQLQVVRSLSEPDLCRVP